MNVVRSLPIKRFAPLLAIVLIGTVIYYSGLWDSAKSWSEDHRPPFSWEKFVDFLPYLAEGAVVTVKVTLLAFAFAMSVGFVVVIIRMYGHWTIRIPVSAFFEFIRNTPLLVQLFAAYSILPSFGIVVPAFYLGVFVLGNYYGVYLSEIYRAGISKVATGQIESATALNMSSSVIMRRVILPQAFRTVIPIMGSYFIGMFKDSVFVSVVAIEELLFQTRYWTGITYRFFELYTGAALFYLVISFPAARSINLIENWLKRELADAQPRSALPWYKRLLPGSGIGIEIPTKV